MIVAGLGWMLMLAACDGRGGGGATLGSPQRLQTLVTLRVPVQVVSDVTREQTMLWDFIVRSKASVVVIARGDVLLGVDMSKARYVSQTPGRGEEPGRAVLAMPKPAPMNPRVDMDRSRTYRTDRGRLEGIWDDLSQDARDEAYRKAQHLIAEAGSDPEMIRQAMQQAQTTVEEFHRLLGWEVQVQWE
jgi:hypothetical protein